MTLGSIRVQDVGGACHDLGGSFDEQFRFYQSHLSLL